MSCIETGQAFDSNMVVLWIIVKVKLVFMQDPLCIKFDFFIAKEFVHV